MKQIISILLTLLLLISNTGITYAQHFCGGHQMMAKVTIGQERLSCGMALVKDLCDESHQSDTHSCCNNLYTQVAFDDTVEQPIVEFQLTPVFDVDNNAIISSVSEILTLQKEVVYTLYNPPPLIKDFPVLFDTFLI
ncbi:MAG: HYC_CC_PP family protein [Flavobacteriales bacterium]